MSRKPLDADFKPEVRLHRADVQLMLVSKEEDPPEQQEWCFSLDQEDPSELPHIKEEHKELWASQEGEQPQWLDEADIIKFTFIPVLVKSEEDDEETPQSSQLHQKQTEHIKTEADGEDCGGPEPAWIFHPDTHDKTSHSSESETDDSRDWEETTEPQSGSVPLQNHEVPVSDMECNSGKKSVSSSECATSFVHKGHLQKNSGIHTAVKSFSCSLCGKSYSRKNTLTAHMRLHSEEKRFSCSVCKKTFKRRVHVVEHMRIHTGEKPFCCSVCGSRFRQSSALTSHLRVHTGEKPFICSFCGARFTQGSALTTHLRGHTGEKPFTCTVCEESFSRRSYLSQHMVMHTGKKPLSCSVCGKGFGNRGNLRRHLAIHTGEKPFSCSDCDKRFTQLTHIQKHKCVGESSINKSSCREAC